MFVFRSLFTMAPRNPRPKNATARFAADRIFHTGSPIVSSDVQAFVAKCVAGWDLNYTEDEKMRLIDTMPARYRRYESDGDGRLTCPLPVDLVRQDAFMKAAINKFQKDVQEGYYLKSWQERATKATRERQEGTFDDYLRETAEQRFGRRSDDTVGGADLEIDPDHGCKEGCPAALDHC